MGLFLSQVLGVIMMVVVVNDDDDLTVETLRFGMMAVVDGEM